MNPGPASRCPIGVRSEYKSREGNGECKGCVHTGRRAVEPTAHGAVRLCDGDEIPVRNYHQASGPLLPRRRSTATGRRNEAPCPVQGTRRGRQCEFTEAAHTPPPSFLSRRRPAIRWRGWLVPKVWGRNTSPRLLSPAVTTIASIARTVLKSDLRGCCSELHG